MKALLKYLAVMALLLFGTDRIVGYWLDKKHAMHFAGEGDGRLMHYLQKEIADTLLMGSSRMLHNVDPAVFGPKTVNLSRISTHIGYQAAVIDVLEQYGRLPAQMIVLNVEPEDVVHTSLRHETGVTTLHYFYNKNAFIKQEINRISLAERLKHCSSVYRHNGTFWELLKQNDPAFTPQGYIPLPPTELDSIRIEESKGQDLLIGHPGRLDLTAIRYLDHIHAICKRNGIQLVIVTAPYFEPDKLFQECAQRFSQVLEKRHIPYINYLADNSTAFRSRAYWHDNNHFNSIGAVHYSNDLEKKVRRAIFRSK